MSCCGAAAAPDHLDDNASRRRSRRKSGASTAISGHQGNLVVDGFLKYVTGAQGWKPVKHATHKGIQLEHYAADEPLGSWRGSYAVEGANFEDVMAYLKDKLGPDNFELLHDDDDTMVFREYFDFATFGKQGAVHHAAGDHRGEAAERMADLRRPSQKPRSSALEKAAMMRQKSNLGTFREESVPETSSSEVVVPLEDDNSDDDEEGDEEAKSRRRLIRASGSTRAAGNSGAAPDAIRKTQSAGGPRSGLGEDEDEDEDADVQGALALEDQRPSQRGNSVTWRQRLFGDSGSSKARGVSGGAGQSSRQLDSREAFPKEREIVFQRTEYGIGDSKFVLIGETVRYKERKPNTTRATMRMMGVLVEAVPDAKKPALPTSTTRTRVTFVASFDPELAPDEEALAKETALSAFGGKDRVLDFLEGLREFFASDVSVLIQRFRNIAASATGENGWQDVERSKNELQLGTNVQHPLLGHGIVQSFDMRGRVKVKYDSGEERDHTQEEKDDLRVAVQIGTRVQHPTRGMGTVKQFDERGRVHVKFDDGEYHRYKQEAWKKKMHLVKLMGIGGALGTVKLSWRPFEGVREGQGRVKFAVGVTTSEVLEYILDYREDAKSGNVLERRVIHKISDTQRVIYEYRNMPSPLTPRDFIYSEVWREVAPHTYVVVMESVERDDIPEKPGCVRGKIYMSGWLLEPLYLSEEAFDGDDHIAKITFQICIDPRGFVAPDSVAAVRQAQLLGTLTDVRAFFWKNSKAKQNARIASNRKSKRLSFLAPGAIGGETAGGTELLPMRISRRILGSKTGGLD